MIQRFKFQFKYLFILKLLGTQSTLSKLEIKRKELSVRQTEELVRNLYKSDNIEEEFNLLLRLVDRANRNLKITKRLICLEEKERFWFVRVAFEFLLQVLSNILKIL